MALSIQKGWEIIFLYSHEYGPKWSQNRIAKYFNISSHTVKKWIDRYKNTGDVKDKDGRGKGKITSPKKIN
jgi:transposase